MGHAGAIISGEDESAAAKARILAECGAEVAESPADMAGALLRAMKR
jgi:succinyl-CoA synthetase alpha subunit